MRWIGFPFLARLKAFGLVRVKSRQKEPHPPHLLISSSTSSTSNFLNAQTQLGSDLISAFPNTGYGSSVSISADGTRIAVGAPIVQNDIFYLVGSVQVFEWLNGEWQQMSDNIEGTEDGDFLGHALSLPTGMYYLKISTPRYSTTEKILKI